jgi:hypothetical protein
MVTKRMFLWLIPVAAVVGPVALYFWVMREKPQPQALPTPAPAEQPAIRYPIEGVGPPAQRLPALDESDGAMADALAALFGPRLEKFFNLQDIVRRVVATVDNLPRENVSLRLMPIKPVPGDSGHSRDGGKSRPRPGECRAISALCAPGGSRADRGARGNVHALLSAVPTAG